MVENVQTAQIYSKYCQCASCKHIDCIGINFYSREKKPNYSKWFQFQLIFMKIRHFQNEIDFHKEIYASLIGSFD